jgi:hypothetical protein
VVSALVRNTGGRALDLTGELRLTDGPGGLSGGPFPAELGTTLAPGDSSPVTVVLDEAIRGGPWQAWLALRSGATERAVEASLTLPDAAGTAADPVAAVPILEDPGVIVPVAVGLLALLLLLLAAEVLRRRLAARAGRRAVPVPPAEVRERQPVGAGAG